MLITIEHSGLVEQTQLASTLQDMLENDLSADHKVEQTIGNSNEKSITLYDRGLKRIAIFTKLPSLMELAFYVNISEEI